MILRCLIGVLILTFKASVFATPITVESILPLTPVDAEGDQSGFGGPFDYQDGRVFTVHVEPGNKAGKEGANLHTVVRMGTRQADGRWIWQESLLESRTILDQWHAQPSIAVDKRGYIHVAYNMHNMPWQYSISTNPHDISSWQFRGQEISITDIETVKFRNEAPFPQLGSAAIAGNQVTYPMFFKDRKEDLYITYRYALKPARTWKQRGFAGGLAKYDVTKKIWKSIGGPVSIDNDDAQLPPGQSAAIQSPFVFEDGYSVYLITLAFDANNGMYAFWTWREGGAGMNTTRPSYAFSPDGMNFFRSDGKAYSLPIELNSAEVVGGIDPQDEFYTPKFAGVLSNNEPFIILQPMSGGRTAVYLDKANGRWSRPEATPFGAPEILEDNNGVQWAFATGLKVFRKAKPTGKWVKYGQIGKDLCAPKTKYISAENRFIVHAKTCDGQLATIFSFRGQR